jgi:hypothetical protein
VKPEHLSKLARPSLGQVDDDMEVPYCLSTYDPTGVTDEQMMWRFDKCIIQVVGDDARSEFLQSEMDHVGECLTPDRASPNLPQKTMFVLGDAHVGVLMPGLVLAVRGLFQVRHVRSDGLGLFPHRHVTMTNGGRYVDIYQYILQTLSDQMQEGDALVIAMHASNWDPQLGSIQRGADGADGMEDSNTTIMEMMETDLLDNIVKPANGKLFVFGEWPYFHEVMGSDVEVDVADQAVLQKSLKPLLESHAANLEYVSLLPLFCTEGTELALDEVGNSTEVPSGACMDKIPGTNVQAYATEDYHVEDHAILNTIGSIYMWPYICDAIEDAVGEAL